MTINMRMRKNLTAKISVFGGARPKPGSDAYQQAYQLGTLLGKAGLTVLTGGYTGAMEATSRGANEHGAHVIGVTCNEIEAFRPKGPNSWVMEEWRCETLQERLNMLIEQCDAAIALPGGVGTLLEICLTWNRLAINALKPKPVILIGDAWQNVFETFITHLNDYISMEDREFIAYAPDPESVLDLLKHFVNISQ